MEGDYNSLNYTSKEIGSYAGNVHLEKVADSYFVKENFILKREEELLKKNAVSRQPIVQQTIVRPIQQSAKHLTTTVISQKNKQKKVTSSAEKISIPTLKKRDLTIENNQLFPANTIQTPNTKIVIPTEVPKVLLERTNQLFKTIQVTDKEIEVSFYDNGEVDGDSISVYLNGKQIAAHKRLTTEPITIKVEINENNPEQEVIMVAENLGTILPNTALMIVKAGGKRYDLNISSNEQKNAAVRFKYQK